MTLSEREDNSDRAVPRGWPREVSDPLADPVTTAPPWNIANALPVFRLVLVPFFAMALFASDGRSHGWRVVACLVFVVASFTDLIDGDLARKRGLITEFGKLADPIADKALIGAALVSLSMLNELSWG